MPRFLLHVNRRSPAWTGFEAYRASELPASVLKELEDLGFDREEENTLTCALHHHGHTPHQWSFAVKLLSLGYNFLNHEEREKCHNGETALMEMIVKESVVDFSTHSHGSNLTLRIYQLE